MTAITSLLIDHREPLWMQRLAPEGATTLITQLACGDAWIAAADGALLIIERKTAEDLLASIADGRLFDQAAAMTAMSPWSYVVVQGTLTPTVQDNQILVIADGTPTRWQWSAVQGALQTIQEMGITVIYLSGDDEREFARFLERLAARDRGTVRAGGARKPELLAPGMLLLMSLPGVGTERAERILTEAGSAAWALDILTGHADIAVAGIGDGTRAKVREALGLPDGLRLCVTQE